LGALGNDEGFILLGEVAYDRTGHSVSTAGDVNGDGFDDFIIGAPSDPDYTDRPGRAYVMFGRDFTGKNPQTGDSDSNTLAGTDQAEVQIGGQGDDLLIGNGGADVARGGQGDDTIYLTDLTFRLFDGGRGEDTLTFTGGGLNLDLSAVYDNRLVGLEHIDLTGSGDNHLTIGNVREVLNISDTSNRLVVHRDADDTVDLGTGWTEQSSETIDGSVFRVFTQGAAKLLVENLKPTLDLNGPDDDGTDTSATFTEDGPAVVITDADLTVADDDQIVSATVTLTNVLDGIDESLAMTVSGTGLQTTYNAATGVLEVTGTASASVYAAALATLRYRNADDGADVTDRVVTVTVNDGLVSSDAARATVSLIAVNDAPQLASAPVHLGTINEDDQDTDGTTVAALIPDGNITDPDGAAVEAMAVILVDQTNGVWQFNTGGDWHDFGLPSLTAARLLGPTDKVRFRPVADYNGVATFRFKAWDQTSGTAGEETDVITNGGTTAFSTGKASATVSVTPVNDAPILDDSLSPTLTPISREQLNSAGDLVSVLVAGAIEDVDGQPRSSIAVIDVDETNGHWEHLLPGTTLQQWMRITASESSALLLSSARRIRFVPDIGFSGTATITFRAWDQSVGGDGTQVDTTQNGGTTPFSIATDTAEITVADTDDPPTLDPISSPLIRSSTEPFNLGLTNITDGGAGTETLTISATSSNHEVLPDPEVSYTAPDTTGQLLLSPVAEMGGWSVVTVTVTEDDGDAITRVFAVSVGDNLQRWQNPFDAKDVNADGAISPIDVLQIVNELNRPNHADQTGRLPNPASPNAPPPYYDVTGDGFVTSRDALLIINCLNEAASGGGEAEGPDDGLSWLAGATGASVNFAVPSVATIPQGSPDNPAVPSNGTGTTSSVVALTKPTTVDAIARHRFFASEEPSPTDDLDSILDTLSADELAKWWS
jgi:hypothetical protein